jgi:cytidylate kinase
LQPASVGLEEGAKAVGQVIQTVADRGNMLILGQGGQILLRGRPAALHVQVLAPFDQRVARVAARDSLSNAAARQRVRANDLARADYLARYHSANWLDPLLYHLVINTGMVSVEDAVQTIGCLAKLVERES